MGMFLTSACRLSHHLYQSWPCLCCYLAQLFFEIFLLGTFLSNKSHSLYFVIAFASFYFLASLLTLGSWPEFLGHGRHQSVFLYLAWILLSSKWSGGPVLSRSSIPCFANSHLLISAMRPRLHCVLISFSSGGVNTVTGSTYLIHSIDAFWTLSLELYRLLQDFNMSIANWRIDSLLLP